MFSFACYLWRLNVTCTDRGLDNWMVKHNPRAKPGQRIVRIAAIDNGLAFPFKHPDQWRSYPFAWSYLPLSKFAFSANLRSSLLPQLLDTNWHEGLLTCLFDTFKQDKDFDQALFRRQVAVVKGQVFNLIKILRMEGSCPADLVRQSRLMIYDVRTWQTCPLTYNI